MFLGIIVFNNNSTVLYTERYSLCVCIQSSPILFDKPISAYTNRKTGVNVVCAGSPSRIRIVRRISFGITTRPRSSIRLTIPVAFIYKNSFFAFYMQCYYLRRITYYSGYSAAEELNRSIKNILSVSTKKYIKKILKKCKEKLQKNSAVCVADSVVIFGNITKKHECFLRTITNFAKNVKQT